MAKEKNIEIKIKYPDGSNFIIGYRKPHLKDNHSLGVWDASSFGDKIGLWTWYAGNGNISKQIIYIR